jgi:hypothetical protein
MMITYNDLNADQRAQVWIQTGLLDLMMGLIILGFGLGILSDMVWMGGALFPALLPSLLTAHKSFTQRMPLWSNQGNGSGRMLTFFGLMLVGLLSLGVAIAFFFIFDSDLPFLASIRSWLSGNMPLVFGMLWTLIFGVTGLVLRKSRFVLYTGLALALSAVAQLWQLHLGIAITIIGGTIAVIGSGIIVSFIRTHPKQV